MHCHRNPGGTNKLVLQTIAPSELMVVRNGDNAILLIGSGGVDGRITIRGQFTSTGKISTIQFDDGTIWTDQTVSAAAIANDGTVLTHVGTSGADTIVGTYDIDVIDGGAGDDVLRGGGGSDVYLWGAGSGNDTISEGSAASEGSGDAIKLVSLNAPDVDLTRTGNDLLVKLVSTGETLKVQNQFYGDYGIEKLVFAGSVSWTRSQMSDAATTFNWVGSATNNALTGNDYGLNVFQLGGGSETATGGARNNIYQASAATGQSTVYLPTASGAKNEIDFTGAITDDELWFMQSGNDLKIDLLGTTTEVTVKDWFAGAAGQLQEITAGGLKIDSQVSQLVQAMASYSAANPGFDPTAASLSAMPNDPTLQSAIAAAWHA